MDDDRPAATTHMSDGTFEREERQRMIDAGELVPARLYAGDTLDGMIRRIGLKVFSLHGPPPRLLAPGERFRVEEPEDDPWIAGPERAAANRRARSAER